MHKYLSNKTTVKEGKVGNFVGLHVLVTVIVSLSLMDHGKRQIMYHQEHGTHIFNTKCQFVSKNL